MPIHIFNTQAQNRLPSAQIKKLIRGIADAESSLKIGNVSVIFMDGRSMRALNKKFLRHDYVTDVISFDLSSQTSLEGEIYVCFEQAAKQAKEYKVPVSNELLRLVAHGMLHILGYDDRSQKQRNAMLSLGDRYISKLK